MEIIMVIDQENLISSLDILSIIFAMSTPSDPTANNMILTKTTKIFASVFNTEN